MKRWLIRKLGRAVERWLDVVEGHLGWLSRVNDWLLTAESQPSRRDPLFPTETFARACRRSPDEEGE